MTNEERDSVIMEKLNEGMSLSDVQKLLESQYGLRMTYLDLRLLAADLQVNWEKQDKPKVAEKPAPVAPAPAAVPEESADEPLGNDENLVDDEAEEEDQMEDESAVSGETQVELDESPIPGTVASGTVKFASGASGKWAVMRGGRLGFEPDEGSAEPTEDDFAQFQVELRTVDGREHYHLFLRARDGHVQAPLAAHEVERAEVHRKASVLVWRIPHGE